MKTCSADEHVCVEGFRGAVHGVFQLKLHAIRSFCNRCYVCGVVNEKAFLSIKALFVGQAEKFIQQIWIHRSVVCSSMDGAQTLAFFDRGGVPLVHGVGVKHSVGKGGIVAGGKPISGVNQVDFRIGERSVQVLCYFRCALSAAQHGEFFVRSGGVVFPELFKERQNVHAVGHSIILGEAVGE